MIHGLYWDIARDLPLRRANVPPSLYDETLSPELERPSGERYTVALPYLDRAEMDVPQPAEPLYRGFTKVMERFDFNVLLPDDGRPLVLLQWLDFEDELIQDVVDLMEFAEREGLLEHALIIDVTDSGGGSHLDQFVSMFADNDLAYIVGMPTGGYSNTWEAEEILHFPGTEQPVVRFMWNVGHTLRPNGEILEGNPPLPDTYIPLTRENFRTYHQILLEAALAELGVDSASS